MSQTNSEFQTKSTTRKGRIGEAAVDAWLRQRGYIPYAAPEELGAHPFDRVAVHRDKRDIRIAEIKAKAARTWFPDTGINERHLLEYLSFEERVRVPVFLFFVDEMRRLIYGNLLSTLMQPTEIFWNGNTLKYPLRNQPDRQGETARKAYFPVQRMHRIAPLDVDAATEMSENSTRGDWKTNDRVTRAIGALVSVGQLVLSFPDPDDLEGAP